MKINLKHCFFSKVSVLWLDPKNQRSRLDPLGLNYAPARGKFETRPDESGLKQQIFFSRACAPFLTAQRLRSLFPFLPLTLSLSRPLALAHTGGHRLRSVSWQKALDVQRHSTDPISLYVERFATGSRRVKVWRYRRFFSYSSSIRPNVHTPILKTRWARHRRQTLYSSPPPRT